MFICPSYLLLTAETTLKFTLGLNNDYELNIMI